MKQTIKTDLDCECGGKLHIEDHGGRGQFRYEVFCSVCKDSDPTGYRTLVEAREKGAKYLGPTSIGKVHE